MKKLFMSILFATLALTACGNSNSSEAPALSNFDSSIVPNNSESLLPQYYNGKPIETVEYTQYNHISRSTTIYTCTINFTNNKAREMYGLTYDDNRVIQDYVFTDELKVKFIDDMYTDGLFDLDERYQSENSSGYISWMLTINYNDNTYKTSQGDTTAAKNEIVNSIETKLETLLRNQLLINI